ncbi:hypothetical protein C8J57DRAFT_1651314 [Mycena rebaudengoi]|nr:hypothetical protein C8J57DRAFT_1651314 [Mycena rebaudengoi]
MSTSTPPYAPPAIRAITAPLVTRAATPIPCAEALYVSLAQRLLSPTPRPHAHNLRARRKHAALCACGRLALPRRHTNGAHHATFSSFRFGYPPGALHAASPPRQLSLSRSSFPRWRYSSRYSFRCCFVPPPSPSRAAPSASRPSSRAASKAKNPYESYARVSLPVLRLSFLPVFRLFSGLGRRVSWRGALVSRLRHIGVGGARSGNVWLIRDSCARELALVLVSEWPRHLAVVVGVYRVARANEAAESAALRRSTVSVGAREGVVSGGALTRRRGSPTAGILQLRLARRVVVLRSA